MSRTTKALLETAQVVDVSGNTVHLATTAVLAKMIAEDRNTTVLRSALTQVVGGEWQIVVDGGAGAAPAGAAAGRGASAPAPPQRPTPPKPEPDPRDDADFDPGPDDAPAERVDPETEAMKLLTSELGARPIER